MLGAAGRLESGSAHGVVYASCLSNQSGNVVVTRARTGNGGKKWRKLAPTPGSVEPRSWHLLFGVDPANDKHVLCNDAYKLFESKDSGHTWTEANTIGDDWVNAAFGKNGEVIATADRNLYSYDATAKAWTSKQGNLQITEFYDITLDPGNASTVYGIGQDHPRGMVFGGDVEWAYMTSGWETGRVLVDPTDSTCLYVSNPLDPDNFVRRSTDGGQNWTVIFKATDFAGSDYDFAYSAQKSFAIDYKKPTRLLVGTTKVWQTTNADAATPTWKAFSPVLGGATAAEQYITALAIAPSDSKTVYAATANGRVWVTTDGGANWAARDQGLFGSGAGRIFDLRVDPKNASRAFAVGSGQSSVWYLDEVAGSLTWQRIAGDLPTYLNTATILSDWPMFKTETLYLGTSRGVYQSSDLGAHWTVCAADFPNTWVSDLELGANGTLFSATSGRGVWALALRVSLVIGHIHDYRFGPRHLQPGEPVEGVAVWLETIDGARVRGLDAVSDERGHFAIQDVPPGSYVVRHAAPPGYAAFGPARERITVNGSEIRDLDLRLAFDPARAAQAYIDHTSAMVLPGRKPGERLSGGSEFDVEGERGGRGRRAGGPKHAKARARRRPRRR
jgi:hypothetical protein